MLQAIIEEDLGIFRRKQKLIFKGKALLAHQTLEQSRLVEGAKVMLLVSGGPTLGQAEAEKLASQKAESAREKAGRIEAQNSRADEKQKRQSKRETSDLLQIRSSMWAKTGIIALRDAQLTALPPEVWELAASAQTVDLTNNQLTSLPLQFSRLTSLQKLHLGRNRLTHEGLPLSLQPAFDGLQMLSISHNMLSEIPPVCILTSLTGLDLSGNYLTSLPESIGWMSNLQKLNLAANALEGLPTSIGKCASLADLILSDNKLNSLPAEVGSLQKLQNLLVDGNQLSAIPRTILSSCLALHTINVHRNPLTVEVLRELPEFQMFDERRRAKYSKQMEMRVMGDKEGFDEGADHIDFARWTSKPPRR